MPPRFAPYRTTDATVVREPRDGFAPTFDETREVLEAYRRIERADEAVRGGGLDRATTQRLLRDAKSRNAYGTASIEGNPLTLADVEHLLEAGPTPDALGRPEEREIVNHAAFLESLPDRSPPTSPDEVADLHAELFDGVLDDAGTFKEEVNFIGRRPEYEVVFVPAEPDRVRPELANALDWLEDADEHPLTRALVFFHEFQSIHPFRDGNGRLGRALLHIHLHAFGYPAIRYAFVDYLFNEDRDGYYEALRAADAGDLDAWLGFSSALLADAFEDARRRILLGSRLGGELNDRQLHVAEWFARLARSDPDRRVKFADVHASFPQVAKRTLKRDLARLRESGVIVMEGKAKGARYRWSGPEG